VNPEELLYAETHEWVRLETDPAGSKTATVGLSDFALSQLTDLVYMDLPEAGRQVSAGEAFGEIESVKAVSDLYSPVSGEIIEVNADLADRLDALADDPYEAGWFVKIRITDESGLERLLDHATYRKQCEAETPDHE